MNLPKAKYRYLGLTQGTADWLQGKVSLIEALRDILTGSDESREPLQQFEFVEGPVHIAATPNQALTAIWNIDYLSGTGEEAWGFIKLDEAMGLQSHISIGYEVLERSLHVINQRLQGLVLDGALIHRVYPNGAHTCVAGRGSEARQFSIGYFERRVDRLGSNVHAILVVGPEHDFGHLSQAAERESKNLETLVLGASELVSRKRKRPAATPDLLPDLRHRLVTYSNTNQDNEYEQVEIATNPHMLPIAASSRFYGLSLSDWLAPGSSLTDIQRRILTSNAIERHPLRIVGPGGSGKTLLMQLLALRQLARASEQKRDIRVLYVAHNASMQGKVAQKFAMLAQDESCIDAEEPRHINVTTLLEYGRQVLGLDYSAVIDKDAHSAKQFQMQEVVEALQSQLSESAKLVKSSTLLGTVDQQKELVPVLAMLIANEISTVIKGHGFETDKKRYVQSERKLSRFHGVLSTDEREFVFEVFRRYHHSVFERYEVLDTDDVALSLLGRLRTPMWELKRRKLGYDYVFVDETQLFNENERRIFPLLTTGLTSYAPIVLALDQAQDVYGQATAGLATLGIKNIANESLSSIHRSTRSIVRLAFFVIQRSVDLFGPDFPDFTGIAAHMEPDNHPLAVPPAIIRAERGSKNIGKVVADHILELRKNKYRQIAVICHADQYWESVEAELRQASLPLHIMLQRGEKLSGDHPIVVLTRPLQAGGQEFDAVILVGLEQGVVPPRIANNEALSSAVEQQVIREIYLAITRARYRLEVVISSGASPTSILQDAEKIGLISRVSGVRPH